MEYQEDIDIPEFREIPHTNACVSAFSEMTMPANTWASLLQRKRSAKRIRLWKTTKIFGDE